MKSKIILRVVLAVAVAVWLGFIWHNSAENGTETVKTSDGVTAIIAKIVVPGYDEMGEEEKTQVIERISPSVRSFAHAFEFFILALLAGAFTGTFSFKTIFAYQALITLGFCVVCAALDEFHQYFVPGRACDIADVLVDTAGAFVGTGIIIATLFVGKKRAVGAKKE